MGGIAFRMRGRAGRGTRRGFLMGSMAAMALPAVPARASDWPAKPVRFVCGYAAGGLTDLFGKDSHPLDRRVILNTPLLQLIAAFVRHASDGVQHRGHFF